MNAFRWMVLAAAALGGTGIWLLLPGGTLRRRGIGALMAAAGLGVLASRLPGLGAWPAQSIFAVLGSVTVASAAAAISLRNPVYCAIWFGLSLVGTAGLLLVQGAQFLAVATIVVYAGAILVTFLFLLMLAEPSGRARYDRTSWEAAVSAFSGAALVGLLSMSVLSVLSPPAGFQTPLTATDRQGPEGVLAPEHVQRIGKALFDDYLIAVELAGILLLVALVAAAVIVGQARGPLVGPQAAALPSEDPGEDAHAGR
ncbi:MAG: NADH-quinone oxidoreductase subunit J family protein [Thermoguttaceae bacterium]